MKPLRIQLRRTKGWRMPENTVKACRPGPLGNPFVVTQKVRPGAGVGGFFIAVPTVEDAVACFGEMLSAEGETADALRAMLPDLRGKNLGCWCALCDRHKDGKPLGEDCPDCAPCHVDPLGKLANPTPNPLADEGRGV